MNDQLVIEFVLQVITGNEKTKNILLAEAEKQGVSDAETMSFFRSVAMAVMFPKKMRDNFLKVHEGPLAETCVKIATDICKELHIWEFHPMNNE